MKPTLDEQARLLSRAFGGRIESRELPDGVYQHTAKAERMEWTTEFPTKAGWYWIRNVRFKFAIDDFSSSAPDPQIINLDGDLRVVEIRFEGARVPLMPGVSDRCADHLVSAEWYGPLESPA